MTNGDEPRVPTKGPVYKQWWFWVIVAIVAFSLGSGGQTDPTEVPNDEPAVEAPSASTSAPAETPAPEAPEPEVAAELPPGEGDTMADAAYREAAPVNGEQVMTTNFESDNLYLMDRFMAAADNHPEWKMSGAKMSQSDDVRFMPYLFADGSEFIFVAVPKSGEGQGLELRSIVINR